MTHNILISTINFSNMEKKNDKYNVINIFTNNNKIYLNLPKLECHFGITLYTNNDIQKYSINLSLSNNLHILNFIENIDDWVTDNFLQNKQWLDKLNIDIKSSKDEIKALGNTIINRKPNFPPYINLKLIFDNNGDFFCDIFKSQNGKLIQMKNIKDIQDILYKKFYISSKIIISNVWIMDKKYGVTLKPKKIVFYENN